MVRSTEIHRGMAVRSRDGQQLGAVIARDEWGFLIEKGAFFTRECRVELTDVDEVRSGEVWLKSDSAQLPHVEHPE